ncbi:hypothetical protein OG909_14855 [Streptomyces sp. NBC_01754]|uniref:hypothetical protein n=1 Tax=Streptomyces sp. NBC_01754 TaxID=2975930 RepID=UPI002DDAEA82|nr:hypothetical protein [Streptomyces sp. NBC_01754]WSC93460.1 hypothetical protein OG909_14855 [Streptomyces sp. NBC_01754]
MKRFGIRTLVVAAGVAAVVSTVVALRQDTSEPPASPPESGGGTATSDVQRDQRGVEEYWTDRRMEEAEPAPMPTEE